MKPLILASGSAIRARILTAAGVEFETVKPDVDEDRIKETAATRSMTVASTATMLADAKALAIRTVDRIVLGSDQILTLDGRAYDKPATMDAARERLRMLSGKEHQLVNAVSIAKNGEIVFRHLEAPRLFMRRMTDQEINDYLAIAGDEVLSSVGAYQVEALGSRLFDRIDGDYFAVLGLSLFPVLRYLREEGMIAF